MNNKNNCNLKAEDFLDFKILPYKYPSEYPVYMPNKLKEKIINCVVNSINKTEGEEKQKLIQLKCFYEKNIEILVDMDVNNG